MLRTSTLVRCDPEQAVATIEISEEPGSFRLDDTVFVAGKSDQSNERQKRNSGHTINDDTNSEKHKRKRLYFSMESNAKGAALTDCCPRSRHAFFYWILF